MNWDKWDYWMNDVPKRVMPSILYAVILFALLVMWIFG